MVGVQWLFGVVPRVGVGLGGLGSFGVDVVAGGIRYLVGAGRFLVVGWVLGMSARWVVRGSPVIMLLSHRGCGPVG